MPARKYYILGNVWGQVIYFPRNVEYLWSGNLFSMIFENIPGTPMSIFSPAISFAVGPVNANDVGIDDVIVQALYLQEGNIKSETGESKNRPGPYKGFPGERRGEPCVHPAFPDNPLGPRPLFTEDFERLNEKNSLENYGWRTNSEQIIKNQQKQNRESVFIKLKPGLASKTLKMQTVPGNRVIAVKRFDIPVDFPFDVSDKPFEIRYNNNMTGDTVVQEPVDISPGFGGHGTSGNYSYSAPAATFNSSKATPVMVQNPTLVDTYYIYTYDGKLLAEYDQNGNCVKDYIYAGSRLIAEYYPPPIDKYYYYMPDQVNSVRIVTDDNGDVVYSAAYGPYGEIEKVWNDAYKPKLKFSGKDREEYTELDYFGARYYDHKLYRFNSVDPVINKEEALYNPQLWNLYAYCRNNPITYMDINGMIEAKFNWIGIYGPDSGRPNDHSYDHFPGASAGLSNITPVWYVDYTVHTNPDGTSNVTFIFEMDVMMWIETLFLGSGSVEDHIEHEAGHLIQCAILFQERKAFLEEQEKEIFSKHSDAHYFAKSKIDTMINKKVTSFENKRTHNREANRWAYENKHRAVPTLGKGVLRYDPKNK